jgi:hypothetical protein
MNKCPKFKEFKIKIIYRHPDFENIIRDLHYHYDFQRPLSILDEYPEHPRAGSDAKIVVLNLKMH